MFPIRDDTPRKHFPFVTLGLILVNAAVFWQQTQLPDLDLRRFFYLYGIVPQRLSGPYREIPFGDYLPFLTSMFLHGGWVHVVGNLWTLWIFGDNVEDRMGPFRFLLFYLLCGVVSGVAHTLANPQATIPAIGASGAIAGVLGAYLLLFPRARILAVFPILIYPLLLEVPAVLYLGFWFLTQVLSGKMALSSPDAGGGVAWWAHVGGFLAGMLLFAFFLRPKRPPRAEVQAWDPEARRWRRAGRER